MRLLKSKKHSNLAHHVRVGEQVPLHSLLHFHKVGGAHAQVAQPGNPAKTSQTEGRGPNVSRDRLRRQRW